MDVTLRSLYPDLDTRILVCWLNRIQDQILSITFAFLSFIIRFSLSYLLSFFSTTFHSTFISPVPIAELYNAVKCYWFVVHGELLRVVIQHNYNSHVLYGIDWI